MIQQLAAATPYSVGEVKAFFAEITEVKGSEPTEAEFKAVLRTMRSYNMTAKEAAKKYLK